MSIKSERTKREGEADNEDSYNKKRIKRHHDDNNDGLSSGNEDEEDGSQNS